MHTIKFDATKGLLMVQHTRFYEGSDIRQYLADLREAFRAIRPGQPYRLLLDITLCAIQSQDAIREFAGHAVEFPPAERIGVATGSSLARRQMRRVLDRPYLRYFNTVDTALVWLREPAITSLAG